ncbi:hypothetical protein SK128_002596 [Halocaridina rubra]|uniref:Uncharacterized protein n=1 Tax=Halocaridina rubra TaxID=373956 RepID=A0AAN8XHY1_HALRR
MDAVQNSTKGFVRLYANCQRNFLKDYEPGNVVIYGMNTGNETATIKLNSMGPNQAIEQYLLEPANGMLKSREVLLNGELLEMTSDEELPEFSPLPLNHNRKFQIPPLRFGFWVIQNAAVANCT